MQTKDRIDLNDTVLDMFMKMSEGNPGALTVLVRSMEEGPAIDPQSALGEISILLALDTHGIYGHEIWGLYKDVCGQAMVTMTGLLRAVQLGFAPESEIKRAIDARGMSGERIAELMAKVRDRLQNFQREVVAA